MKIPVKPPNVEELFKIEHGSTLFGILNKGIPADPGGKYYHWDKLRYLTPPENLSLEHWWLAIKVARNALRKEIKHFDKNAKVFSYAEPDMVRRMLHEIDIHGGGELKASAPVANPDTKDSYLINSLIEESITSSQLEGAATTRQVAKDMLRRKRKPRDKSETMIVNNYHAMEFINENHSSELTPEFIYELHRIVTRNTLDKPEMVGCLRQSDDIYISDERDGSIVFTPPKSNELPGRIESLCRFANESHQDTFIHPVLRAIILHFLLAYDHPFVDGNGRTARALFYWSMLRQGYWVLQFISISRILKSAPVKYAKAYLYTETDDSDMTYFIVYQLEVIKRAIRDLLQYLEQKANEINVVENFIKHSPAMQSVLNHRQLALISRALKKSDSVFSIQGHQGAQRVTYDTARTDLLKLVDLGLLTKAKIGKAFVFYPVDDLRGKLGNL